MINESPAGAAGAARRPLSMSLFAFSIAITALHTHITFYIPHGSAVRSWVIIVV